MTMRENRENTARPGSGLSPAQIAGLTARLHDERRILEARLAARRERLAAPALREPDDADWAASSEDQALLVRLIDRDSKLLGEIDRALARVAAGSYGVCELSGEPIGFERLQVRRWTRYAAATKESVERRRAA
jgi:DnaK suppressor protein